MFSNPNARGWGPKPPPRQAPELPKETTAVDLPRVPGRPAPNPRQGAVDGVVRGAGAAPARVSQDAAEVIRREVAALLPDPVHEGLPAGLEGGRYPGKPTFVMGERVWCWRGALTGKWWAFVPRESRLRRHNDRLVEAGSAHELHARVAQVLQETRA